MSITPADQVKILSQYEDEILEVIECQLRNDEDSMTQSDLQGRVMAIVSNIFHAGMESQKNINEFKRGGEK